MVKGEHLPTTAYSLSPFLSFFPRLSIMNQKSCQCPNESWHGWNETRKVHSGGEVTSAGIQFGLEMQCPYAELLLKGHKTIETRSYPLPSPLLTKANDVQVRIEILESESGQDGVRYVLYFNISIDSFIQHTSNIKVRFLSIISQVLSQIKSTS